MDATEVVPKLPAPDSFGRAREPEGGESAVSCPPVFGGNKVSGCGSGHKEYNSVSRKKRADAELCVHDNPLLSFKHDEFGRRQYFGDLSPKNVGKQLIRKSLNDLSTISCNKRQKREQAESSIQTTRADLDGISKKIGSDIIRCTSSESRLIKKKRGQDCKKTDKKIMRGSGKIKHDCLPLKPGFANSDIVSGGNDILGIYGLKSDLHDVTKHMNELSLEELLDGSYKYSNLCLDKGKKLPHVSENIISSVRKACAVLSSHCAKDSSCSKNAFSSLQSVNPCLQKLSDCDNKDKCTEESETFRKVENSYVADMSNSTLCQPRVIFKRLELPPVPDLDALLLEVNTPSLPLMSTGHMTLSPASLPPFTCSFPYNGPCRHSVDLCKLASARNLCQGRWVRIGSSHISSGDGKSCLSELDMKACYYNEDPLDRQMVDDLPQDVKSLNSYVKHSCEGLAGLSHIISSLSEEALPDKTISAKGAEIKMPDRQQNFDSKDYASLGNLKSEGGLKCQGDDSKLVKVHEDNDFPQNGQPAEDLSPSVLAAAEILYEMSVRTFATWTRDHNIGRMKWQPKEPSKKVLKACRPMSPILKGDKLSHASRHHDPVSGARLPIMRHKSASEKNSSHMNSVSRRPVKLSVREGSPSARKSERDLPCSIKSPDGISFRTSSSTRSPIRADKSFDNLHRVRKTSTSSSVSFGGVHIKDWSRGRIKRL